jgi:hypothetical protein
MPTLHRRSRVREEHAAPTEPTHAANQSNAKVCIDCSTPLQNLYIIYGVAKNRTIQLTTCKQCNKFADKYLGSYHFAN